MRRVRRVSRWRLGLATWLVLTGALAAGCAAPSGVPTPAAGAGPAAAAVGEVTVFAAASLTEAFREIGAAFAAAQPGARVTFNFGASPQLRTQLEHGARADVFASADTAQMDAAARAGLLAGDPRAFAGNRLVVIAPRENPGGIASVRDLAQPGVKLVATPPSVPIGQYTLELLDRASADPAYGADFRARVEANVVSREDNVRQAVAKVVLGEADAAVCYATDVTPQLRGRLVQVAVPDPLQTTATYPIALARGGNPAGGRAFAAFVLGPQGQEILERWGFVRLPLPPA